MIIIIIVKPLFFRGEGRGGWGRSDCRQLKIAKVSKENGVSGDGRGFESFFYNRKPTINVLSHRTRLLMYGYPIATQLLPACWQPPPPRDEANFLGASYPPILPCVLFCFATSLLAK